MDGATHKADLERRVIARLRDVANHGPHLAEPDHLLVTDFGLDAIQLLRVAELLEEEFGIVIPQVGMLQLALDGPTVGHLCDLVDQALADA
jgi:acyl carrier protein